MSRSKMLPIDGWRLRRRVLDHGYITQISEELGYAAGSLTWAIRNNRISVPMAQLLENKFGIKYEYYSPVKIEPTDRPNLETKIVKRVPQPGQNEAQLNTIISQLAEICNELTAIHQKLGN